MHESNRTKLIYFTTLFSIEIQKDICWDLDLLQSTHRSWHACIILQQKSFGSVLMQYNLHLKNAVQNPKLLLFNCWNTVTVSLSVYAEINCLTVHAKFWSLCNCRVKLQLKWSCEKKVLFTAHLPNLWSNFSSRFTPFCAPFCLAQSPHALLLVHSSIFHCLPPSETCGAPWGSQITPCLLLSFTVCC